jgi:hypothetical protein
VSVALVLCTAVAALGWGALALAKLTARPQMQARAAHVGLSTAAYRRIGALELSGAGGLLTGLAFWPFGAAAAIGLLALLCGAVVAHRRADDPVAAVVPAVVFGLITAAYLILLLVTL